MFFRIDYFQTQPAAPIVHRRRSSHSVASNVFAHPSELPVLAMRARARVIAASAVESRASGRVISFAKLAAAWRKLRGASEGPRAA